MAAVSLLPDGWVSLAGVDLGDNGVSFIHMTVRSEVPAGIEILTDSENGEPAAVLGIPECEQDTEITAELPVPLSGIHDLYFRFTDSGISLLEWRFR